MGATSKSNYCCDMSKFWLRKCCWRLWLCLLFAIHLRPTQAYETADCSGKPADVVFLLDTSNSIWHPDFLKQLEFVRDVTSVFTIGPENILVGITTFAETPRLQFDLSDYKTKKGLDVAIKNVRQSGGYLTRTADALRYMRQRSFQEMAGARKNVTKIGIVITDGLSSNRTETAIEAARTRDVGIHLFAVGVGASRDLRELESIASTPTAYYTFEVDSYQGLDNIKDLLAIKACQVTDASTTPTTISTTPSEAFPPRHGHDHSSYLNGHSQSTNDDRNSNKFDRKNAASDEDGDFGNNGDGSGDVDNNYDGKGNAESGSGRRKGSRTTSHGDENSRFASDPLNARLWRYNTDGTLRLAGRTEHHGDDRERLEDLENATDLYVQGDIIWGLDRQKREVKVGCVFNGTHYVGFWVVDDDGHDMWYGYPINNLKSHKSENPEHTTVQNFQIYGQERRDTLWIEGESRVHEGHLNPEGGTRSNDHGNEYWVTDEQGQRILFRRRTPNRHEVVSRDRNNRIAFDPTNTAGFWGTDDVSQRSWYKYVEPNMYEPINNEQFSTTINPDMVDRDSKIPVDSDGRKGYWETNPEGRKEWFRYVCPGTYVKVDGVPPGHETDVQEARGQNITYVYPTEADDRNKLGGDGDSSRRPTDPFDNDDNPSECVVTDEDGQKTVFRYDGPGKFVKVGRVKSKSRRNRKRGKHNQTRSPSAQLREKAVKGCTPLSSLDLIFIIDPKSKNPLLIRPLWEFARNVIENLDFEEKWVRVRFVHDWQGLSGLDEKPFVDKNDLLRAVDSAVEDTRMSSADLIDSMSAMFSRDPSTKSKDTKRIGIIVTDGRLTELGDAVAAARTAEHDHDVNLFAVGVGSEVNGDELRKIVGEQQYFAVNHLSKTQTVAQFVATTFCEKSL